MLEQPARARPDGHGHQVVEVIVNGGYHPDAIIARAGIPLRLVFLRNDRDACTERVVFSAPRIDRRIAPTGRTTVDLPAQPPGEIRFTCGMGRYRGRITLLGARTPSLVRRLRDRALRRDTALGTALVLWILTLPLISLAALVAFDVTAAVIAAGLTLIAWVGGCLWATSHSTEPV